MVKGTELLDDRVPESESIDGIVQVHGSFTLAEGATMIVDHGDYVALDVIGSMVPWIRNPYAGGFVSLGGLEPRLPVAVLKAFTLPNQYLQV